jgi:uncharacterized protein with ParB-like and HNH nuclease domain
MPFKTPITVKTVVNNIHAKKYLLPNIQRELVWNLEKITKLFDSLMRDYPIGSFLFWKVEDHATGEFQFYEFLREYHERDSIHNPKANVVGETGITAILDGQQRFTSLYLGLKGSYTYRMPRGRWDDPRAFPKRELYLNLLAESKDPEMKYDFQFLTDEEKGVRDENTYWFKVGKILDFDSNDPNQIFTHLVSQGLSNNSFAGQCLFKLSKVTHSDPLINYFEEEEQDLDKVLQIFVRINSGEPLTYSDMLLSIAAAQWQDKDARDEIYGLVDELNNTRDGFAFNKDYVLKACLVLSDTKDIAFKINNFNASNMRKIEQRWEEISAALQLSTSLAANFGFSYQTLTANYALIPIAYYLLKKKADSSFIQSARFEEDRRTIRKWLTIALLKQIFGGQPDNVLRPIRNIIRENYETFPVEMIKAELKGTKTMKFGEEEIEELLSTKYGGRYTFLVLSLLYPNLDYRNQFHQDHVYPKSFFTSRRKLTSKGIPQEKQEFYINNYNYLANLQLLEGPPNQEKSDSDFQQWLNKIYKDKDAKSDFMRRNFIPTDLDLSYSNFEEFFKAREDLIKHKLKLLLID